MTDKNKNHDTIIVLVLAALCFIMVVVLIRVTVFADEFDEDIVDIPDDDISLSIDDNFSSVDSSSVIEETTLDDILDYLMEGSVSDYGENYSFVSLSESERFEAYFIDDLMVCVYDVTTLVCYYYVNGLLTPIYNQFGELVTFNVDLQCQEVYH